MEAAKEYDAAMKQYEASTRPSTTQSTTTQSSTKRAMQQLLNSRDVASEVYTMPSTQPSR
jgi:hypothetical protein